MVIVMKKYFNMILFLVVIILMIVLAIWISNRLIQHLDQKIPNLGMPGPHEEKEDLHPAHVHFQ
jgi:hypothetical protein